LLAKLILSLIIIISAGIIGYVLAYRYVERNQELKNLYIAFQLLETEIMYSSSSLPIALKRVGIKSKNPLGKFFTGTYKILDSKQGIGIEEAWSRTVEETISETSLNNEDKDILLDFGFNLGSTDKEHQMKNFQFIYLQLKKRQDNAENLRMKNEKMFKTLGILIGIAIAIVFV